MSGGGIPDLNVQGSVWNTECQRCGRGQGGPVARQVLVRVEVQRGVEVLLVWLRLSAVVGAEQQCWGGGAGCCTPEAGGVLRLGSRALGPCVAAGDSWPGSALLPPKMAALPRPQCEAAWGTRLEALWGWGLGPGHGGDGAVWGGRLGTVGVPPGRQQNRVRLPAHPAMAAVTKHRPRAGVAGDVLVSCLAPALGGWGSPSPARGLPAAAITQHRWPWGGLWAGGIWS